MTVDNIDLVKEHLHFRSEDDFYYLQILQRKKENINIGSNSRVIKNYYITSVEYLCERYDEIRGLCDVFKARAMLRLNRRSFEKVGFQSLTNLSNTMSNREYKHIGKCYDRACGMVHNEYEKKWIVDIDGDDVQYIKHIRYVINQTGGVVMLEVPTKNGIHLVTSPFYIVDYKENLKIFNLECLDLDIHKDNPINLYIP